MTISNKNKTILPGKGGSQWEYAGRFWRGIAGIIDMLILFALVPSLDLVLAYIFRLLGFFSSDAGVLIYVGLILTLLVVIGWLYFGCFESSAWQASPGKKLCKMIVVDSQGERLSFADASFRVFLSMLRSKDEGYVNSELMADTDQKQGLEDMVSDTLVLRRKSAN